MPDATEIFVRGCQASNHRAAACAYPPFTTGLRQETTLNSAPYLYDSAAFRSRFAVSAHRSAILTALDGVLTNFARQGIGCAFLLIGGSFLRFEREPADLDALLLYTVDAMRGDEPSQALIRFAQTPRSPLLDLRLCPADCDPLILVKRCIFFSNLFSFDRASGMLVHGTVVVFPEGTNR